MSPRAQQALSSVPAFRGLGEDDRRHVAGLVREVLLEKGRIVYRAGDEADALYLVASGAVDVLDGENTILRYGPGEIFGESVLLAGERRRVTTRIALDALLLVLSRAHLERLLELHPSLHERVAALLMRRLKDAVQVARGVTPPQRSEIVALQG